MVENPNNQECGKNSGRHEKQGGSQEIQEAKIYKKKRPKKQDTQVICISNKLYITFFCA